jgi:serine protease Do
MTRHLALVTAGLASVVGLLVGLVLAGQLTPSRAVSAERDTPRAVVRSPTAPPVLTAVPRPASVPPSFADIAERVNPAVVTVSASARGDAPDTRRSGRSEPDDPFFRGPDRERRGPRKGAGTGFVVDPDGYLVTNYHVVEGAERITVRLSSGQSLPAEVVGADPDTDIALLRLRSAPRLPAVTLGNSDDVRVGEWVVAIGNPLAYEHTVTAGVVSFLGRKLFDSSFDRYIQTDAAINLGNSGGPLINTRGEVIGINAAVSSRAPTIGFAIPINQAKAILPQLRATGRVTRGYAGLFVRDVDPDLRRSLGWTRNSGAVVQDVTPGSPAERAGLRPYDVVVAIDGQVVASGDELVGLVASRQPGETVSLQVSREDRSFSALVKLAERPPSPRTDSTAPSKTTRQGLPRLGLSTRDLDRETARRMGAPDDLRGVVVWRVDAVSAAADAGVERGDVILEIGRQPVSSHAEYQRLLNAAGPGDVLTVYLYKLTTGQRRLLTVRVDER